MSVETPTGGAVPSGGRDLAFRIELGSGDERSVDRPAGNGFPPRLRLAEGFLRGSSPCMESLFDELARLAGTRIPILFAGETGTGKELLARTVHRSSPRSSKPFVAINCAAIPADLLETELFGIEKGVATGVTERPGRFAQAKEGTLFLDEIGEMPLPLQAKLLRVLQAEEVTPVGGRPRAIDVRVVSATNADIERRVEDRRFRSDLFYRLAGSVLSVPPLRERPEDLPALVEAFFRRYTAEAGKRCLGVTVGALDRLMAHPWPGNVRELQNEVRRLAHLAEEGAILDTEDLSLRGQVRATNGFGRTIGATSDSLEIAPRVAELERALIEAALQRTGGVQIRAAKLLGISRNTLAEKIDRWDIEIP